jgi:glycerate dehydrogenase
MKAVFLDFDTLGPEDIDLEPLEKLLPDIEFYPTTEPGQIKKRLAQAEIVIVNKVTISDATIYSAGELKLICLAATGTDNVSLEAAAERGVAVCNIRDYCTQSVVQHVFALILSLTHHIDEYSGLLQGKAWAKSAQFCMLDYPIRELADKALGIVGLGNLGQGVANVARAFRMRVLAARQPYSQVHFAESAINKNGIQFVSLNHLLEKSDIVSLHCPLNDETENLIDTAALASMRSDAVLINTARGGLVDSAALVSALQDKKIAAAGIDVLREEPPLNGDPILDVDLPNLIVTPHIAWAARESRQRALDEIAANIDDFINGGSRNRVV